MNHDDYRSARRAIIRRHHPDVGGDRRELQRRLEALEITAGRVAPQAAPTTIVVRRRRLGAALNQFTHLARSARSHLPRRVPGARRYARTT